MDPTTFREYLREFNAANYAALVRYYADDVIFSFGHGPTLRGRARSSRSTGPFTST